MKIISKFSLSILLLSIMVIGNSCKKDNSSSNTPAGCTGVTSLSGTGSSSSAKLKWNGGASTLYNIQYRVSGTQSWLTASSTADSATLTGLNTNSNYEWQVKNACMTGFSSSSTFSTAGCDAGFEGADCKTETRAKFIGAYTVSEQRNGGSSYTYPSTIIASSRGVTEVLITSITGMSISTSGFFTANIRATISGNALTIPNQQPDSDGYSIVGSGVISGSTISLQYSITGPGPYTTLVTDNYNGTWTKQ